MIISSLEWARGRRKLVQESKDVLRIGNRSSVKFGTRDVSDLRFLPGLSSYALNISLNDCLNV